MAISPVAPSLLAAVMSTFMVGRDTFTLLRRYACNGHGLCVGEFAPRRGVLHLNFGSAPLNGTWLTVWQ